MTYWLVYFLILILGIVGPVALFSYLRRRQKSFPWLENLIIMGLAFFVTLMVVEFYFKVFFAQIDSLHTLARQNWYQRYYPEGTFNSLGYRDIEWTNERIAGKTKVMIVGDSFVEGVGIKNPDDRFSNLLGKKLGSDYVVFNLGKRGANTPQEIEAVINYPHPPDILVLSYFINDIEDVRWWIDQGSPPDPGIPGYLEPLVNNSYAANFVYWRLYRLTQGDHLKGWWVWLQNLYADPEIWWLHQQDLLAIYDGVQAQQIPFIVVVFPNLTEIDGSAVVTKRVIALFQERGVTTLDVGDLVRDIPPKERVVSPVDAHPSELVHRLVAEALYDKFVELGLVDDVATSMETR